MSAGALPEWVRAQLAERAADQEMAERRTAYDAWAKSTAEFCVRAAPDGPGEAAGGAP